ncbi:MULTISPECIES: hypothetical protein [unclassified Pseudomonas]|uniref:hypothetical protein n=1 Tax=unclassified Pseudomonas TaxID=196821 RepID=UPI002AC8C70F|nr:MULTISPECIES: hypothetical protein [unclassified Pseudomonas]MEB0043705.1 hypothetical protein [Pseudomonas sp. MH10]MEB0121469.1 hypothetical protein [Pseudomonas sp. CCI1.2]WPX64064.1 hypothetical protein RHM59_24980 [Pseudomonas sp. MH10]
MLIDKEYYFHNRFMEVPVKCDSSYPSITKILEALYVMIYEGTKARSRPRGYHVRLRFTKKMTSQTFSARLSTFYKRKSGYTPLRLTVVECDEDEEGLHHHFAIILNDRLDRRSSLQRFMAQLLAGGFLADYKVVCPDTDAFGHHLRTLEEKDSYFEWMTYLAKVATKADTGQVWSTCRVVSRALKEWKLAGKPDLRKQLFDQHPKDSVAVVDIFEDLQLVIYRTIVMVPRTASTASHRTI